MLARSALNILKRSIHLKPTSFAFPLAKQKHISRTMTSNTRPLCLIPGPVEMSSSVLQAHSTPATAHTDPKFVEVFGQSIEMLRQVVATETAQPFIIAGSGTLGWDQAAANLIEAQDNVLVLSNGYFGEGLADCLECYGGQVTRLRAEPGNREDLSLVRKELQTTKYKAITVTQVDTSTGVLGDVQAVAKLVRELSPDTLVIVDGVCATAAERLYFDAWGVDVLVTASQKALGCPAGISVVVASQRALATMSSRATPDRAVKYFATPCVQTIFALNTSLKEILANDGGMEGVFVAHERTSERVKGAVEAWGLRTVAVSREAAATAMTAVWLPEGIQAADLLPKLKARGVVAAGGILAGLAHRYFRLGHMGITATQDNGYVDVMLAAVAGALEECGHSVEQKNAPPRL
ncbi:pyridoxal phosphate-dependent transferase [Kickxella alabastrina]|uniref:pyridoxal phosphate-dependent transferase n=1 Tax=Kickxella alabastrina TaxID=61397 RepID=UPI00221E9299|nr:pyridoxal phosphate-dependent transferase [Kickxella alabastrina]KAI7830116.1 pyridoxal phosphate-dependent transferase [Kickxella alabastrina]